MKRGWHTLVSATLVSTLSSRIVALPLLDRCERLATDSVGVSISVLNQCDLLGACAHVSANT